MEKTVRLHIFKSNETLANYAHNLCVYFNQNKNYIEVQGDLACLDIGSGCLVAMTKCIHTAKQISPVSQCVIFHYIPQLDEFDLILGLNTKTEIQTY
jgi:hypothetical protein